MAELHPMLGRIARSPHVICLKHGVCRRECTPTCNTGRVISDAEAERYRADPASLDFDDRLSAPLAKDTTT